MATQKNLVDLATKAYIYGFPFIFNTQQIERYVTVGIGGTKQVPFNNFTHASRLAEPSDKFVSVNNDTIYSNAPIDVSAGPVVLSVPDTSGRYYVLQFVDAWSNNFAYVGKRATGTSAGKFLLTPPNWNGDVPADMIEIKFPTNIGIIIGRLACDGEADLPTVRELQEQLKITPLNEGKEVDGFPEYDRSLGKELAFFEQLRVYMAQFPPAERDLVKQESFAPIGLMEKGVSPYSNPSEELKNALIEGAKAGLANIKKATTNFKSVNGWGLTQHLFDYNADFFEIGTKKSLDWVIEDREEAYIIRAVSAITALWGNHGYEAVYLMTWTDTDGNALNGKNKYTLELNPIPPVDSFWSITMYDLPEYFLCENPINRYSIGDRTPGIQYNDDGGITIVVSKDEPTDPKERANWLPAPDAEFRPMFRLYNPQQPLVDGSYHFPGFEKK
ncbi:DUF1254 domain-containing protein [Listeria monocytogenes]|uniref:DUF1254 domain-containing protein n=1 Tax=Listeria monocytogenes TaxID=1639 RepID=UPI0008690045|nr:DUF1254 domain-containing protein [Listeria monocytogenes]OEQ41226.1 hypothetical protein AJN20_11365 [Listeria monocytogenes]RKC61935.1 hypothetical protein AF843_00501 [Listeria monocytogenes]